MEAAIGSIESAVAAMPGSATNPAQPVPVTQTAQTLNVQNISTPARGEIVNNGTSTLIDPLVGNAMVLDNSIVRNFHETVGSEDMTTKLVAARRSLLQNMDWHTDSAVGYDLYTGNFPRDLLVSTGFPARDAVKIHEYLSGKALEFTIQCSASPFSAGVLQVIWRPSYSFNNNMFGTGGHTNPTYFDWSGDNMIDTSSLLLNIGEGNTATLRVPLTNLLPVLRPPCASVTSTPFTDAFLKFDAKAFNYWGQLYVRVYNKLNGAPEDEDIPLNLKIYAEIIDPFFAVLRPPRDITNLVLQDHGAILSTVASAAMPAIEDLAVGAATSLIQEGISKVGKHCTLYKPINEDPMSMNMAITNDLRHIVTLGYDSKDFNDSSLDSSEVPPEMSVKHIVSRRSRIKTIAWAATASGDLWSTKIGPLSTTTYADRKSVV